jgi:hypothetical protein
MGAVYARLGRNMDEPKQRPNWLDDRDEHEILVRALVQAVRAFQPRGRITLSEEQLAERVAPCIGPWFDRGLCLLVAAHQGGPQSVGAQFLKRDPPDNTRPLHGRPGREPRPGERVSLGLRVTPSTKNRLDQAAAESGRSQSQEAELRIENSFYAEDMLSAVLERLAGNKINGVLAETLARIIGAADEQARRRERPAAPDTPPE